MQLETTIKRTTYYHKATDAWTRATAEKEILLTIETESPPTKIRITLSLSEAYALVLDIVKQINEINKKQ